MKIELHETSVRDLTVGYADNQEGGVTGYGGRLDIRPPFQREFVYKDKQRAAVIETIRRGFPLNVLYWAVREGNLADDEREFEVIDGQQRTISICQYIEGEFSVDDLYFHNLTDDQQAKILDYVLMIYRCTGTDSEKLEWFKVINIAGEELTEQELRNAVYHGSWVSDAKRYFSRPGGPAYAVGNKYLTGDPVRQKYLETAIKWINDGEVESYMAQQQHKPKATDLWLHFKKVVDWVEATFTTYRGEMKGIDWGMLYAEHADDELDSSVLEEQIGQLMADVDVTSNKGVYIYVLSGDERHLSIRAFDERMRRTAYEQQKGICPGCSEHFDISQMQADHKVPWSKSGKTVAENCVMLCAPCNRKKWDI
ncbi:MAG: DUF262 domain-containing protein [Ilumatobacter sp.]|uniref:GmrSD restriction endonuclease domain-containing protein n=1 Tax=Ilumatobacter sp. TaxID=1967498 RepID=UPI0032991238